MGSCSPFGNLWVPNGMWNIVVHEKVYYIDRCETRCVSEPSQRVVRVGVLSLNFTGTVHQMMPVSSGDKQSNWKYELEGENLSGFVILKLAVGRKSVVALERDFQLDRLGGGWRIRGTGGVQASDKSKR